MSITLEERAARSRENGRMSRGPKTPEGKERARGNALKHGLRADVLPIPGEDPTIAAVRGAAWHTYYQPQSPAAHHLVNECARATLRADRLDQFEAAAVAHQRNQARLDFLARQSNAAALQAARLSDHPAEAHAQLLRTAAGCRYLIERWEHLKSTLKAHDSWKNREATEAVRLMGGLNARDDAWMLRMCAAILGGSRHETALRHLFQPGRQPASLGIAFSLDNLPSKPKARQWLESLIELELEWLHEEESQLREAHEVPELTEALELAYISADLNTALAFTISNRGPELVPSRLPRVGFDPQKRRRTSGRRRPRRFPERTQLFTRHVARSGRNSLSSHNSRQFARACRFGEECFGDAQSAPLGPTRLEYRDSVGETLSGRARRREHPTAQWSPNGRRIFQRGRTLRHEILYQPSFSLAVVTLERGESIMAESGAMISMSPTIRLEAQMAGGGMMGAFKSAVGGESLFRTTFTAESGPGEVTLAPSTLGDILSLQLTGNRFFVQPGSYLAGDPRLAISVQGSVRGMLSGEGLFLLTVEGTGLLLLSSFGAIHEKNLGPGEEYIVDTGHIVAFENSIQYRLEKATGRTQGIGGFLKGMVQSALSGEGFVCRYRGPGRIYIQTRQLPSFARQILPFLPKTGG